MRTPGEQLYKQRRVETRRCLPHAGHSLIVKDRIGVLQCWAKTELQCIAAGALPGGAGRRRLVIWRSPSPLRRRFYTASVIYTGIRRCCCCCCRLPRDTDTVVIFAASLHYSHWSSLAVGRKAILQRLMSLGSAWFSANTPATVSVSLVYCCELHWASQHFGRNP